MARSRTKVFFDGGCRPNPGPMEVAAVVRGQVFIRDDLGHGSNGDAEWEALLHALEVAQGLGLEQFELLGDSLPVIERANGVVRPKSGADMAYCARFAALSAANPPARIRWIKRAQNHAGIALAARHGR
jgi:ribonuclease HI